MELLAAIDVLGGEAVRLVKGAFDKAEGFGDPLAVAARFLDAGSPWLHVVDLEAARTGSPANRGTVLALAGLAHEAGARIEVGGGIRSERDVDEVLAVGVDRVVLGTAAIETPELALRCARRYPGRVAVGLDYRRAEDGSLRLAVRGWEGVAGRDVTSVLAALGEEAVAALVVTAIDRDGTRTGPDLDGLAGVLDATAVPVVASGGVGRLDDLVALGTLRSPGAGRRVAGVVAGRALVDGTIDVQEAVAACAASG